MAHATYTARPGKAPRTGRTQGTRTPVGIAPEGLSTGSFVVAYGQPATVVAMAANRYGQPAVACAVLATGRLVYLLPHNPTGNGVAWGTAHVAGGSAYASTGAVAQGHYYGGRGAYGQDIC